MSNPVAIITGGAGGMGAAAARKLADTHHVILADLNEQKVAAVTESIRATGAQATGLTCNLTEPGAIKQLLQTGADLGELRALVHTAGVSPQMAAPDAIIDINAVATQNLVDAFLDFAVDGAAAVLVASVAGLARRSSRGAVWHARRKNRVGITGELRDEHGETRGCSGRGGARCILRPWPVRNGRRNGCRTRLRG